MTESFDVLGVRVHKVDLPQVLDRMQRWIEKKDITRYVVATQMHGLMVARRNVSFRNVLNSASLFVPDGFSVVWAAKLLGSDLRQRVPGPDLFIAGCSFAENHGYGIFLYGDTEETLLLLQRRLIEQFPNLKISGVYSPPFRSLTAEEDDHIVDMINLSGADIVWVGLGAPRQEQWMYDHREKLNVPVLIGVGAAFKFSSGRVSRAPTLLRDHGFEWMWRFCREPGRVWRRVLIDGPHFFACVLIQRFSSSIKNSQL